MSASIPIPGRNPSFDEERPATSLQMQIGGMSLPVTHRSFINPARHSTGPPMAQDDIATSWPPRPSVRLVSRSARKWLSGHRDVADSAQAPHRSSTFQPWDFSEVASASNEVQSAFRRGSARAERPPREGVCGTYFIRRVESKSSVLCVFKPVDEEAGDLETSPTHIPRFCPVQNGDELAFGPSTSMSQLSRSPSECSPLPPPDVRRSFGCSSESERESSRFYKQNPGFHAGEGAYKEVAAYLLDQGRFARVPQTALATCNFASDIPEKNKSASQDIAVAWDSVHRNGSDHVSDASTGRYFNETGFNGDDFSSDESTDDNHMRTKMGAFQVYVENNGDADDFGPGVFPKDQVHKIAVLDIRTLNHDRHGGNILVVSSKTSGNRYDLIPIDHGYILPDVVNSVPWPVWMDWSMIREEICDEVKNYIARLDAESEALILHDELDGKLRAGSLRSLRIATSLLQQGVAAGLTLYDIGLLIYNRRECPDVKSELVKIIEEAEDAGLARKRHIEEETSLSSLCSSSDGLQLSQDPSRSLSSLSTALSRRRSDNQSFIDDYIVKYARKRISEVVNRIAANKAKGSGKPIGRARSIPDFGNFGIGVRPLHAMFNRMSTEELPTPLPSPVDKKASNVTEELEAVMRKPIRIPIDGNISQISIPIPDQGVSAGGSSSKPNGPVHRRIASERPGKGSLHDMLNVKGRDNLPPLLKATSRKSSPVGPLDVMYWEQ